MVEPELELRSLDSKSSALCSTPCFLMNGIVSAVKNIRRKRLRKPIKVRSGFVEATKGDMKWAWKAE